jgi:hypothetical protein
MRLQCTTFFYDSEHLDETIAMLGDLRVALLASRKSSNGDENDPIAYIIMLDELRLSLTAAKKAGYHGESLRS